MAVHLTKATEVGTYAFYNCTNLASIYMPEVTRIWSFAFGHCESLTQIEFANLTTVFTWAFENCSTLTTVNMPKVTWLDAGAFAHCQKLTDVSITTSENCKLTGFGSSNYSAFYNAFSSSNITLTIGSANSEYISGNTLTLDGASATFKEIIFVDNYDEAVGDTGDAPDLGYEELF